MKRAAKDQARRKWEINDECADYALDAITGFG